MDNRVKELIAVGASVTANCQPCLKFHVNKATEYGVSEQESTEAIEVAKMVRKGAAFKMDELTSRFYQPPSTDTSCAKEGCGCGS